jgi:hypothetical protein
MVHVGKIEGHNLLHLSFIESRGTSARGLATPRDSFTGDE